MNFLLNSRIYDLDFYFQIDHDDRSSISALFLLSCCHLSKELCFRGSHYHLNDIVLEILTLILSEDVDYFHPFYEEIEHLQESHQTKN